LKGGGTARSLSERDFTFTQNAVTLITVIVFISPLTLTLTHRHD
jgi:hypothetical protein